ncbi:MAG: glycosyltransferase family protein [Blastocatellales bacterium]
MLAICEYLIETNADLSILLVTGSPVIHNLRLPAQLDYIKLPCLMRSDYENYDVKFLGTEIGETIQLRSDLILSAVANYKPDLFLIDKKPYGVKNELMMALNYARLHLPESRRMLVLRDILDSPQRTVQAWRKNGYYDAVEMFYDRVFVLGAPEVFDLRREYELPAYIAEKVSFCGYLQRKAAIRPRFEVRDEFRAGAGDKLVLLTPGGGQDGFEILSTYLDSLECSPPGPACRSILVSGPEMPQPQKEFLRRAAAKCPQTVFCEFTNDLMSLMNAADVVVSMGGYNTVCELLSLDKRAVVIPRVRPAEEQLIRAQRMAARGLFSFLHPDRLTPASLKDAVSKELARGNVSPLASSKLDMGALPNLAAALSLSRREPERVTTKAASFKFNALRPAAAAGAFA